MSEEEKTEDTEEKKSEATEEIKPKVVVEDTITTTESIDISTADATVAEVEPEEATTEEAKARYLSVSTGTGLTVFNGSCPKCGARIANGILKDEKINCPTCKQDF